MLNFGPEFLSFDLPAILTATSAAISCALVGNYLLLRKQSLMGDAISHSVLPGIVLAFLWTGSRGGYFTFLGAALAGVFAALTIEVVRRLGKVDPGASMGVVFSILFALGVILIERASARGVDLDAECILHGQLETVFWQAPRTLSELLSLKTLSLIPTPLATSVVILLITICVITLCFKELTITSFDRELSDSLGISSRRMFMLLMVLTAGAVVASFQSVGPILVIAMLICPPATARMITDTFRYQILWSVVAALFAVVVGYSFGAFAPALFGIKHSLNAAGAIAVTSGFLLALVIIGAPRYGIVGKSLRRARFQLQVIEEDLLGILYRAREVDSTKQRVPLKELARLLPQGALTSIAVRDAQRRGWIAIQGEEIELKEQGIELARSVVRSHRLWENFLVSELRLRPDHVHQRATEFEHFTSRDLQQHLSEKQSHPEVDPHGKEIPK